MTEKTKIDKTHDRLILQAKKLALVELQLKVQEQIDILNTEIDAINPDEDDIPF